MCDKNHRTARCVLDPALVLDLALVLFLVLFLFLVLRLFRLRPLAFVSVRLDAGLNRFRYKAMAV